MKYRVDVKLGSGGKCQLVVPEALNEVDAANRVRGQMLEGGLITEGEAFDVTFVRALRSNPCEPGKNFAEMAVVGLVAVGMPVAGLWELLTILG